MKLYVVRHGQTEKNLVNIVHGQTESELTKDGIEKAEELKREIDKLKIDAVVCSPLGRAKRTAEILIGKRLPVNVDDRLIDRNWGLCEGAKVIEVDRVKCWDYYLNYQENCIEPLTDFMKRIIDCLHDLKDKHQDENVLIVTHSAVSRVIYYYFTGIPENGDLSVIDIPNLHVLEYDI